VWCYLDSQNIQVSCNNSRQREQTYTQTCYDATDNCNNQSHCQSCSLHARLYTCSSTIPGVDSKHIINLKKFRRVKHWCPGWESNVQTEIHYGFTKVRLKYMVYKSETEIHGLREICSNISFHAFILYVCISIAQV
ncbi:unnamed protein product, partial [Owenia fusiformis]